MTTRTPVYSDLARGHIEVTFIDHYGVTDSGMLLAINVDKSVPDRYFIRTDEDQQWYEHAQIEDTTHPECCDCPPCMASKRMYDYMSSSLNDTERAMAIGSLIMTELEAHEDSSVLSACVLAAAASKFGGAESWGCCHRCQAVLGISAMLIDCTDSVEDASGLLGQICAGLTIAPKGSPAIIRAKANGARLIIEGHISGKIAGCGS